MDLGAKLALSFGESAFAQKLAVAAEQLRADVCAYGMAPTGSHFVEA